MHPSQRTQSDQRGDAVSLESGISFPPDEDIARQEFADEADINKLLMRFGVQSRPLVFGEFNQDLDLLTAFELVAQAEEALGKLPREVIERHGGIAGTLAAIANNVFAMEPPSAPDAGSSSAATGGGSPQAGEAGAGGV